MEDIKKLAEKIQSLEERVTKLEAQPSNAVKSVPAEANKGKGISVKEFIISSKPSGDVQKTLAIGYYLEKYEKMASFNVDDISRHFQLAKESTPQNINDKINMNIKKGHLMEADSKKDNKKAWVVTNTGEQFLENGFKEK
jgi:polyhydroxyalkanoate synthesis regulator phasin